MNICELCLNQFFQKKTDCKFSHNFWHQGTFQMSKFLENSLLPTQTWQSGGKGCVRHYLNHNSHVWVCKNMYLTLIINRQWWITDLKQSEKIQIYNIPGHDKITHLETKTTKLSACISMLQFTAGSLYFHDTVTISSKQVSSTNLWKCMEVLKNLLSLDSALEIGEF